MAATVGAATSGSRLALRKFLDGVNGSRELVTDGSENKNVTKLVVENAVIVFGKRGCCMCHVVKRLLLGIGVNPAVYEVDQEKEEAVLDELSRINGERGGGGIQLPAVFVGGKLFGGLDRLMSTHISGDLVPILNDAGALWL